MYVTSIYGHMIRLRSYLILKKDEIGFDFYHILNIKTMLLYIEVTSFWNIISQIYFANLLIG